LNSYFKKDPVSPSEWATKENSLQPLRAVIPLTVGQLEGNLTLFVTHHYTRTHEIWAQVQGPEFP
jgi:hypothetical protein